MSETCQENEPTCDEVRGALSEAMQWALGAIGHLPEAVIKTCEESDFAYRIVRIDGKLMVGLWDCDINRLNISIDNGIVTEAYLG